MLAQEIRTLISQINGQMLTRSLTNSNLRLAGAALLDIADRVEAIEKISNPAAQRLPERGRQQGGVARFDARRPEHRAPAEAVALTRSRLKLRTICQVVADYYGVDWTDITSARRGRDIVRPRQVTMWAVRRHTALSLPQIGRRCGGRDHTTVLHACRKIDLLRETDVELEQELREVEGLLADRKAQLAQHLITPEPDRDPVEVADRIVSEPASEWPLTLPEIQALALAVILRLPPADKDEPKPARPAQPPAPLAPVGADRTVNRLIDGIHEASLALESARFSARERAALTAFERSLNALSNHFKHAPKGNPTWNTKLPQPRLPRLDRTMIARASSN